MSANPAIVFPDTGVFVRVCGPNDVHLSVLEEVFAAPVHVRGNEIALDTEDETRTSLFAAVLGELERHVQGGGSLDSGLIRSVHDHLSGENAHRSGPLSEEISIPVAGTTVVARSAGQARLLSGLGRFQLSFCIGPAGTGKTYLAVAHALQEVLAKRLRKIILTRPVVEAGENLGYLPGDLSQKVSPYLRPLYDAIESLVSRELMDRMQSSGMIEVAPLAYMRGRSLRDVYVILDEAQNTTREQMKMFLTRLGENSRSVVTGDITQIDLPKPRSSGLLHAMKVLEHVPEIGIISLGSEDIVRSRLVRKIIKAYDEHGT